MTKTRKKYNLPTGYPFLPTLFRSNDFLANPIKFISKSMEKFGGTYTATLGLRKKIILTQDPAFIEHILRGNHRNYHKSPLATERAVEFFGNGLLFSNGDYWLRQRRLVQPAFHREKLQGLYDIVTRSIDEFLRDLPDGEPDIYPLMHQISFSLLIRSLFDIRMEPATMAELGEHFTALQEFLLRDVNRPVQRLLYPFNGMKRDMLRRAKRLKAIIAGLIRERRSDPRSYNDLLDMLLSSRYEDSGEHMTDEQVIDEALILIFAGHETTANALSWMLYLLATHPAINNRLVNELKVSSPADTLRNPFVNAVISESMRLYPPAWMTERVAVEDDRFGDYHFPKGTIIIPFFFGLHRNAAHWPEPARFHPDRFINDPSLARSASFFPFGAGPRMCIGNNFAMAEMCFFLHSFLTNFTIAATPQVPEMRPLITLRPDRIVLKIERISTLH
ncbi:MAG: cytochrome P450 [Chitinophagaceae bacterium]|nr:MAG: cytochrome P450 [Chitinophagaceae bacterium]